MIRMITSIVLLLLLSSTIQAQVVFLEMEVVSESALHFDGESMIIITNERPNPVEIRATDKEAISFSIHNNSPNLLVTLGQPEQGDHYDFQLSGAYSVTVPSSRYANFNGSQADISPPTQWNGRSTGRGNEIRFYIYGIFIFDDNRSNTIFTNSTITLEYL